MITLSKSAFERQIIPDDCPDTSYLEQEGFEDRLEEFRQGAFDLSGSARSSKYRSPMAKIES